MQAKTWFYRWLQHHKTCNPHAAWKEPQYSTQTPEGKTMFGGWIKKLDRLGITEEVAFAASQDVQGTRLGFPEHHLEPVTAAALAIMGRIALEARTRETRESIDRAKAEQAAKDRHRPAWTALPEADRQAYRDRALAVSPGFRRTPGYLEQFAFTLFAEEQAETRGRAAPRPPQQPRTRGTSRANG